MIKLKINIKTNNFIILFVIINLIIQIFSIENKINNKKRKLDSNNYDNYVILKVKNDGWVHILGAEKYY